ncbi:hypothetical protein BGW39_011926 [Mortierella sp. 14UC]|nr:hypothetical protein BGW39_011926 [Mortierella sp. 14UC]
MADYLFSKSLTDSLQNTRSFEPEVGERDALEALENLILLHESVDQLESWKKFLDSHAALSLPPWRTSVKKDRVSIVVSQTPKALLLRTPCGRTESAPTKVRVSGQVHNVSALIPAATARQASPCTSDETLPTLFENDSPFSSDSRYNYKTSYWQFKCRQDRVRHDSAPDRYSPRKKIPLDTAVSQSPPTHPFDLASGTLGIVEDTTIPPNKDDPAGSNTSSAVSSAYSQLSTPVPTPQVQPIEFIAPPMKDLYSAPIIMDPSRHSERSYSPAPCDTAPLNTKRSITAAINVAGIKAAKKRPSPIILATAPLSIPKSTATTSVSPTTTESFITKMFTQNPGEQDDVECQTAKKGWRIWDKPLMHLKRKSFPSLPALPSLSVSSVPPVPTLDRADLSATASRTSSPITVPVTTSSKLSPGGTSDTAPTPRKPFKRPALTFKSHNQSDATSLSQSPRLNLDILYNDSTGTSSPSSIYSFSSRDGSVRVTSSPSLGCSIASIPFPDDYMSIDPNSALWSSPSAQTPPPLLPPVFPSPSGMDSFPKVTSVPPLPPSPTVSATSRTKRLQEKLFGRRNKKSLSSMDDFCSSSTLTSTSSAMSLSRTNVLHGGVAGFVVTSTSSGGAEVGGESVEPPVLKTTSSLGSLREKAPLGHLLASHILKTGGSRTVGTVAATAAAAATSVVRSGQDPKNDSGCQCHEKTHDHDRLRHASTHLTTTPTRTSSKSSSTSTSSSSLSSPSLPKASRMIVEYHQHHQQLRQQPLPGSAPSSGDGGGNGVVAVAIVGQTSERDEKEANDQIWRVINQWRARKDAHEKSS